MNSFYSENSAREILKGFWATFIVIYQPHKDTIVWMAYRLSVPGKGLNSGRLHNDLIQYTMYNRKGGKFAGTDRDMKLPCY